MKRNVIISMMSATLVVLGCTREPLSPEVGPGSVSSAEMVELNVSTSVGNSDVMLENLNIQDWVLPLVVRVALMLSIPFPWGV